MLLSLPIINLCGHRPHLKCRTYAPWMTSKVERELLTAWGLRGGTNATADEISGVKKRGPPTLSAAERGKEHLVFSIFKFCTYYHLNPEPPAEHFNCWQCSERLSLTI